MELIHKRSLPHWYVSGAAHFVTYRLAGSLPVTVVHDLNKRRDQLLAKPPDRPPAEYRCHVNRLLFVAYEKYLDQLSNMDWLRNPRIASMLRQNFYHHDGNKYHLHAYCVMPNHVHLLLTPSPQEVSLPLDANAEIVVGERADAGSPLSTIMHSLKSYTANMANRVLHRTGTFWQPESYDHWARNDDELERITNYIRANPATAGLVSRHEDWPWCSCHDRFLIDGETTAWLPTT
ncbi:protein containing DUF1568 [Rhodopirellula maiorica SM1]|uniref:Protein containing DUF1568 n=1 Tax=Rhodopirellula maiorica SM1 TaxID=1265738 RepID=M5RX31_9BACT|nr:transposase [Rhodopirellula maiorica]EMI19962.1 protein containing DUF1568 [Rhodopirellula maiorica SM1]